MKPHPPFKPPPFLIYYRASLVSSTLFPAISIITTMKTSSPRADPGGSRRLVIPSIFFVLFLCALASFNEIRIEGLLKLGRCARYTFEDANEVSHSGISSNTSKTEDEMRILIGILTLPDNYPRRHFLRMVYAIQERLPGTKIDVRFVFCSLNKEDQTVLIALEIMQYNDIIILNCTENMNQGKTYTYFSSLPEILASDSNSSPDPPYHYVMKCDDDTFVRLESFANSLKPLSREDLYYGYVIPCPSMDPFGARTYMSGMGYLISWDIVEWLRSSEIPKKHLEGPEDLVFGEWLRDGRRAKNRYNAKWSMYDLPEPRPTRCTHELWPNTVAVHKLKKQDQWVRALKYFNFTNGLKPSKLYHIP